MNSFTVLLICALACFVQTSYGQCSSQCSAPRSYGCGGQAYGGVGTGNVAVNGQLPASGNTCVSGQVPILGSVCFNGDVPASGCVSINGNCAQCGCNGQNY